MRPSIIVDKWGIKTNSLLGYAVTTDDFYVSREFSYTRAGTTPGTLINASGNLVNAVLNTPRIDYTGGSPSLLVEPSGQNLAFHSESWVSGNNWGLLGLTNATGAIAAPNGTITANALSPTAVSGVHFMTGNNSTTVSYTSGTIYTQSAFFKAGTGAAGQLVQLTFASARFTQEGYANFDLSAGTVSVVSGSSADANRAAKIENYGNGWYRCIFTATCNITGTGVSLIPVLITASGSGRTPSFTGVTGDILYAWGAQLEVGSIATTYIPTTTASLTRDADVCTFSNASSLIGQTEGTIYAEVDIRNMAKETYLIRIDDGATANNITLRTLTSNVIRTAITAPTTSGTINISSAAFNAGIVKIAFAYKSGEIALSVNGATALTANGTFAFNASLNRINLGSNASASSEFNDRIRAAALYTTRLSNAQLIDMTWQ